MKMDVKELRIGNWVKSNKNNYKIANLSIYGIEHLDDNGIFMPAKLLSIQPIEITEEWLLAFGFSKFANCYFLYLDNHLEFFCKFYSKEFVLRNNKADIEIKDLSGYHVHQLQNIYFALTGKELELKEVN